VPVAVAVPDRRWSPRVEATAYFVVAEALANAAKHAGARRVSVEATPGEAHLEVAVRDDGAGGADPQGRGLEGLRDRVEAIGGTLEVVDGPEGGTVVTARLPVES
jgi:signal transduction histidine kinase